MYRVLFTLFLSILFVPHAIAEKRLALVIGNSAYTDAKPLDNPVRDATLIAETLRKLGFEVIEAKNVTLKQMKRAVSDYSGRLRKYGENTVGFIFYAGHGVQVKGLNYLIPVDARIKHEGDVATEAMNMNNILYSISLAGNRVNLIVFDACRDNPYRSLFRSNRQGLATINAPKGSLIAYSSAPGQVATDGDGNNSPFSLSLAKHLTKKGLTIEQILKHVGRDVQKETGGHQRPWRSTDLNHDFYPAGKKVAAITPSVIPANKCEKADRVFSEIKDQKSCAIWKTYLNDFANCGHWTNLARSRYEELSCSRPEARGDEDEVIDRTVTTRLQRELKRVGCYNHGIDGRWGNRSKRALARFVKRTNTKLSKLQAGPEALDVVLKHKGKACVSPKPNIKREKPRLQRRPQKAQKNRPRKRPNALSYSWRIWAKGFVSGAVSKKTPYGVLVCTRPSSRFEGPERQCHWR